MERSKIAIDEAACRRTLQQLESLDGIPIERSVREELVKLAILATRKLFVEHICDDSSSTSPFIVYGTEDSSGINWTLRRDLRLLGRDAKLLSKVVRLDVSQRDAAERCLMINLRLLSNYYRYIQRDWWVSPGTKHAFRWTRNSIAEELTFDSERRKILAEVDLAEIADLVSVEGHWLP